MAIDLASNTEVVRDEIAWLEGRLGELEDWRALGQLEAREARGEGLNAVDGQRLKALLLQSLSDNPLFERYNFLLTQTGQASGVLPAKPTAVHKPVDERAASPDDLGRIRGISKTLARRLSGLGVARFAQIANWTSSDVQHVGKTLGIGRQISSENWIEQAALLARGGESALPQREIANRVKVSTTLEGAPRAATAEIAFTSPVTANIAANEVPAVADQQVEPATVPAEMVLINTPLPPAPLAARTYACAEPTASMTVEDALAILGLFPPASDDTTPPGFAEPETPFAAEPIASELFAAEPFSRELGPPEPVAKKPVTAEPAASEQPSFEAALEMEPAVLGPPPVPLPARAFAVASAELTESIVEVPAPPPGPLPASQFYVAREIATAEASPVSFARSDLPEATLEPAPINAVTTDEVVAPAQAPPLAVQAAPALPAVPAAPLPAPPLPLRAAHYATGNAGKRRVEREHWMFDTASELRAIERLLAQPMPGQFATQRSAPEARVTIKRGPDVHPQAALTPAAVEVPVKRPAPQPALDAFDGSNYAAYRDHIEEASVEIINHRESADTAQLPPSLPEPRLRSSAALEIAARSTLDWFVRAMKRA